MIDLEVTSPSQEAKELIQHLRAENDILQRRPDDPLPAERESMLIQVNAHLERLLAKSNQEKKLLRNMKNHYWARTHVCKVRMKMFQRRWSEALRQKKRTNPLRILAEASLKDHGTH